MTLRLLASWALVTALQLPAFRAETRLVVVHATVRNERGELVTNLTKDAFAVYENGKRQAIALFRSDDVPVSLGLLIDNSGSMRTKRSRVEAASLAFARASNPRDEIFVLNFADKPRIDVHFTSDVRQLEAGIARVDSIGGTAMRDAVAVAEGYLDERATRDRRALVIVTDGNDNASEIPLQRVRTVAQQRDIVVYAIGLLNGQDQGKAKDAREELNALTESTGGIAYYPGSLEQIDGVALDLAHQIRTQYTLGYMPSNQALDGSFRKIRVEARGSSHLVVLTRPGYRATAEALGRPGGL
jgi:Ca-activated chloride channel family protein